MEKPLAYCLLAKPKPVNFLADRHTWRIDFG